ncbi:MAG TPA: response regulator transcription factor [Candidatus Dormibacteraeota bacterium]|jgi:DNA-binding response OmpR family regulator|nr:response regulator transcription factor [Candidatus Dormibacteraeota bacterium]
MSRILIVEDEEHLAQGLRFNLEEEGHAVEVTDKGEEALKRLLKEKQEFDALVLDVMLPGKDGFTVARELREAQNYIPLLMLTARGRQEDVLKGFEAGADDYLTKPFTLAILLARLDSMLRRKNWARRAPDQENVAESSESDLPPLYKFGDKTIDFQGLKLHVGKETMQLTLMEMELLRYLIRRAGQPVSRKAILEDVWDLREDTDTRAIDNFIVRLRKYIEKEPSQPKHLLTVRGVGYEFVPNPK